MGACVHRSWGGDWPANFTGSRFVELLEKCGDLVDRVLQEEGHVGGVKSALIEALASLDEPEAVDDTSLFTAHKQVIE